MNDHGFNEGAKLALDMMSVGVVIGTFAAFLPPIAALLTIIWTIIRIWETDTVRRWTGRGGK